MEKTKDRLNNLYETVGFIVVWLSVIVAILRVITWFWSANAFINANL